MSVEVRISESYLQTMMSAFREQHTHFNILIQKKDAKVDVRVAEDQQEFNIPTEPPIALHGVLFSGTGSNVAVVLHVWDLLSD